MLSNQRQRPSKIFVPFLLGLALLLVTGLNQSCGSKEEGNKDAPNKTAGKTAKTDNNNPKKTPSKQEGNEPDKAAPKQESNKPDKDTGWVNGGTYPPIGSPKALRTVKDRPFRLAWLSFPPTLRTDGPQSNLVQTRTIHSLMYESLIGIHPETEQFIPLLAKEWRIQTWLPNKAKGIKGHQVFWFRLNPKARFSTGKPVTAKDVYYSFWHLVQEDRNDPSNVLVMKKQFEMPEIVDDMTIKVKTKNFNWRLFLYFGGSSLRIYPAEDIHIDGKTYLEKYNWEMLPGTGPYSFDPKDMVKGKSLLLRRRHDWWAENEPWAKNTYNFELIKFRVVRDDVLTYEKFKADEFDLYRVMKSQRWVEEVPKEKGVQKGWIQARKIHNKAPAGFSGFAFNMRKPPFNDRRVRLAFAHLFDVDKLNKQLFFNQYQKIRSYYPGREWGNDDTNPRIDYDPDKAEELLFQAGYKERNDDGWLVNAKGEPLELTLEYGAQSFGRIWLVVQKDLQEAGIKLNLKLIDPTTLYKKVQERKFLLTYQSWGALLFPNPRTSWSSELADKPYNNNLTGFKNPEVDKLLEEYDLALERPKQVQIVKKIDSIVFNDHPYALGWYANFQRILYWNRMGHPKTYFTKIGDDPFSEALLTWWWDPSRIQALEKARKEGTDLEPRGQITVKPWDPGK